MKRIILLDLNYTLVENSHQKRSPFLRQIDGEVYRGWLVDLLRPEHVVLITARPLRYREATLRSIRDKTGWEPQAAYFNAWGCPPPVCKARILEESILVRGRAPADLLAIESNPATRAMYAERGIRTIHVPEDDSTWLTLP